MVTNTVNDLAPNGGAWNLVLNAQGRIQGDLTTLARRRLSGVGDRGDQYDRLLAHLEHFIIMDDVELVPLGQEAPETAVGLTGPQAGEVLERMGSPTLSEPMTGTRVEWNGWSYGSCAATVCWARTMSSVLPAAGLTKALACLSTAGAIRWGRRRWKHFASRRESRCTEQISQSAICRRKHRRPAPCTSTRAAIWGRRSWSASARAGMCTGICVRWNWKDRYLRLGLN